MTIDRALKRLKDLHKLEDGWMWGEGKAVDKAWTKAVGGYLLMLTVLELPLPHIYPTVEGGIMCEWSEETIEFSVEFGPTDVSTSAIDMEEL